MHNTSRLSLLVHADWLGLQPIGSGVPVCIFILLIDNWTSGWCGGLYRAANCFAFEIRHSTSL